MPVAIDATVAGALANSYVTLAEANTYFTGRLYADLWTAADDDTKSAALVWAARLVDTRVHWRGTIPNYTQSMMWPRSYVVDMDANDGRWIPYDIIPKRVKEAQCEQALACLSTDRTLDDDSAGLSSASVGSISVVFDRSTVPETLVTGAMELLSVFGTIYGQKVGFATVVRT